MTDECEYLKISLQRHNIDLENHGTFNTRLVIEETELEKVSEI